jgi:hypothetical protein
MKDNVMTFLSMKHLNKVQTSKRAENSETIKPMQILFHIKLLSDRYFQENFKTLKKHPLRYIIHNLFKSI